MNHWTRMLKSIYRKEPIISFMVTVGAVDAVIGAVSEHWSLTGVGLGVIGVAIALRFRQMQTRRPLEPQSRSPVYVLPPAPSSLPLLTVPKNNPPRR